MEEEKEVETGVENKQKIKLEGKKQFFQE